MTVICYPVPLQSDHNWEIFLPCALRFAATWKQFLPQEKCTLAAVCLQNDPDRAIKGIFADLPVEWMRYDGDGYDVGAALWLAPQLGDAFMVCMNSRVFFHRSGWLKALVRRRSDNGYGLYGTSASRENRLHFRTACYGIDAQDLAQYPMKIASRADGYKYESGLEKDGYCLLDFVEIDLGWPAYIVHWSGLHCWNHWLESPNGFRRGTQEDLLVWDEHIINWQRADNEERQRLSAIAYNGNKA